MKKLFTLFCIVVMSSCVQPTNNNNSKKETIPNGNSKIGLTLEQLLTPKEGVTPAKDLFSGSLYKTNTSGLFFNGIKFDKDTNICFFTNDDFILLSCLRKVTGNTIEFDFTPYYSRVKNYTIEEHCINRVAEMTSYITEQEEKLKTATTEEEKTEIRKDLTKAHKFKLDYLNALINKNYDHISLDYNNTITSYKKAVEFLKTLAPITAQISSDNNSITLKKMLKDIYDLDENIPEYVENIVFIKQ